MSNTDTSKKHDIEPDAEGLYQFHIESLPRYLIDSGQWMVDNLLNKTQARGHVKLRRAHSNVLLPLKPEGGRLVDLAKKSGISKNALGELADELEELGYVERLPDPNDGRAKKLCYTEMGFSLLADTKQCIAELNLELEKILGKKKLQQLTSIMADLAKAIKTS